MMICTGLLLLVMVTKIGMRMVPRNGTDIAWIVLAVPAIEGVLGQLAARCRRPEGPAFLAGRRSEGHLCGLGSCDSCVLLFFLPPVLGLSFFLVIREVG